MKTSENIIYDYCANSILGLPLDRLRVRAALTRHWELANKEEQCLIYEWIRNSWTAEGTGVTRVDEVCIDHCIIILHSKTCKYFIEQHLSIWFALSKRHKTSCVQLQSLWFVYSANRSFRHIHSCFCDKSLTTAINEYLINIRNTNKSDSSCRNIIKSGSKYTTPENKAVLFLQLASQLTGRSH